MQTLLDKIRKIIPVDIVPNGAIMDSEDSVGRLTWKTITTSTAQTTNISTEFKITIEECLDQQPMFKDFVLIHEYTHTLDIKCNKIGELDRNKNIETFFNCNGTDTLAITTELFHKLIHLMEDTLGMIELKSTKSWYFSSGNTTDTAELIANFGAMIYHFGDKMKSELPKASSRFIELLNQGYYGDEPKEIFKHLKH